MKPATPHSIGRYEIVEPLATGGMATVYLARLTGPGGFAKLVALKTIHPHLVAEDGFVEMFLDEARIASRITHPNVCQIVDFGVGTGSYFIAMELLLGENLAKLRPALENLEQDERHVEMVSRIVADAALGLHAAHEVKGDDGELLQVVHRDISHSNLIVTFDGVVKVVDFGIASAADQLHLTRTGTLKGKFAYMAPEQLEQQGVDRRADLWSLGVVLWEMLTGERLFTRKRQVDSMRAVLDDPIPLASSLNPDVMPEMDAILARALDRAPEKRFASALDFAQALDALAATQGWTFSAQNLGEHMRRVCSESFEQQSAMVLNARSASATSSTPSVTNEETQTRRASPVAVRREETPVPASDPGNKRRAWTSMLALAVVTGTAAVAYFAGSRATPEATPNEVSDVVTVEPDTGAPDTGNDATPTPENRPPTESPSVDPPEEPPLESAGTSVRMQARRAPGFVNITTPGGWADVVIGGRNVGRTPLRTRLPAGRRRVVLRPFGRGNIRRTVTVVPREATRLVVPVEAR